MTFSGTKNHLKALPCGKKLNHALYITEESLKIVNKQLYKFVADLKNRAEAGVEYNVIKFFTNEFKISWLSYPDFFTIPHPSLKKSLTLNVATGKIRKFSYNKSINPPILHRKETFLQPGHPQIETFSDYGWSLGDLRGLSAPESLILLHIEPPRSAANKSRVPK